MKSSPGRRDPSVQHGSGQGGRARGRRPRHSPARPQPRRRRRRHVAQRRVSGTEEMRENQKCLNLSNTGWSDYVLHRKLVYFTVSLITVQYVASDQSQTFDSGPVHPNGPESRFCDRSDATYCTRICRKKPIKLHTESSI